MLACPVSAGCMFVLVVTDHDRDGRQITPARDTRAGQGCRARSEW